MKKSLLLLLVILIGLPVTAWALDGAPFGLSRGEIKYEFSGAREGTERLVFDQGGQLQARYIDSSITVMGMKQEEKTVNILNGEWAYNLNLEAKTGTRMNYKEALEQMKGSSAISMTDYSEKWLQEMGAVKKGTDQVLERTCDLWFSEDMGYEVCLWKGIPLRYSVDMMGVGFASQAVLINENPSIDPDAFVVPADITLTDIDPAKMPTREDMQAYRAKMKEARELMASPEMREAMESYRESMENPGEAIPERPLDDEFEDPEASGEMIEPGLDR